MHCGFLFMVSFACELCPNGFVVQVGFCALMCLFEPSLNDLCFVNECILGTVYGFLSAQI